MSLKVSDNQKNQNFERTVNKLIDTHHTMGCDMSMHVKSPIPSFASSLFSDNMGNVIDEHGENFHQLMQSLEQRYKRKWSPVFSH